MKHFNLKNIIAAAAFAATALGANAQPKGPAWLGNALFYQIYPSSYMDTDGNGIGDLPGITHKLDYIKSLGVNALWLNPIFESGWFDGGYDVIDFYKVDPRFGTNSDLVALVNEAHKRGIKVCLDLVAGHTSDKCAWFKDSMQKDTNLRYSDYYIWTEPPVGAERECPRSTGCAPRDTQHHGVLVRQGCGRIPRRYGVIARKERHRPQGNNQAVERNARMEGQVLSRERAHF